MEDPTGVPFVPLSQDQISQILVDADAPSADTVSQQSENIRQWLVTETAYSDKIDDKLIHSFLVGNKFDLEATKEKIQYYAKTKDEYPMFFVDRDPASPALQLSSSIVNVCILPKPTPEGYRVVYSQISNPGSKAYNIIDYYKRLFLQMDLLLSKDHCCRGYVYVLSGKSVGLWHASHWTVNLVRGLFDIIGRGRPESVIGWFFMDMSMILKPVFTVTMKVLGDDSLKKKVHYNDKKTLETLLPKDILPKQYGGNAEYDFNDLNGKWQTYLEQNRDIFI